MQRTRTISDAYLGLQKQLHENPDYGIASLSFAPIVAEGGIGALARVEGGWSLAWSGPDGARQTTWFPARPSTVR
jgi:hypothetical protein